MKEKEQVTSYLHSKEDEVAALRQEAKKLKEQIESTKNAQPKVDDKKVAELDKKIRELTDENETLLV